MPIWYQNSTLIRGSLVENTILRICLKKEKCMCHKVPVWLMRKDQEDHIKDWAKIIENHYNKVLMTEIKRIKKTHHCYIGPPPCREQHCCIPKKEWFHADTRWCLLPDQCSWTRPVSSRWLCSLQIDRRACMHWLPWESLASCRSRWLRLCPRSHRCYQLQHCKVDGPCRTLGHDQGQLWPHARISLSRHASAIHAFCFPCLLSHFWHHHWHLKVMFVRLGVQFYFSFEDSCLKMWVLRLFS